MKSALLALTVLALPLSAWATETDSPDLTPPPLTRSGQEIAAVLQSPELAQRFSGELTIDSIVRGASSRSGTCYFVRAGRCTAYMRAMWLEDGSRPNQVRTYFDGIACE